MIRFASASDVEIKTRNRKTSFVSSEISELNISSTYLVNSLEKLGFTRYKTVECTFPPIPDDMYLHFIRGYVDGDGCLSYYWNKQHTSINTQVSIVSTESFLNSIKKLFGNKHGYIRNKSSKNWENKAYQLTFNGVIARKFARYLYEKATIYMQRKYEKYLYFCRLEEESSLRKSSKIGEGWDANTEVNSGITKGPESL